MASIFDMGFGQVFGRGAQAPADPYQRIVRGLMPPPPGINDGPSMPVSVAEARRQGREVDTRDPVDYDTSFDMSFDIPTAPTPAKVRTKEELAALAAGAGKQTQPQAQPPASLADIVAGLTSGRKDVRNEARGMYKSLGAEERSQTLQEIEAVGRNLATQYQALAAQGAPKTELFGLEEKLRELQDQHKAVKREDIKLSESDKGEMLMNLGLSLMAGRGNIGEIVGKAGKEALDVGRRLKDERFKGAKDEAAEAMARSMALLNAKQSDTSAMNAQAMQQYQMGRQNITDLIAGEKTRGDTLKMRADVENQQAQRRLDQQKMALLAQQAAQSGGGRDKLAEAAADLQRSVKAKLMTEGEAIAKLRAMQLGVSKPMAIDDRAKLADIAKAYGLADLSAQGLYSFGQMMATNPTDAQFQQGLQEILALEPKK